MSKRKLLIVAMFLFLLSGGAWFFQITPPWELPRILTAMRAKEYCTCHFLLKMEHDYCQKKISKGYPFLGEQIVDDENKVVTFSALGWSHTAKFVSERFGCSLSQ